MVTAEDPYGDDFGVDDKEDIIEDDGNDDQNNQPGGNQDNSVIEFKVVRPETFASVTEIADYLLNHCTVVLNLEATNREAAKRIIDFLAGVAYSINGQLKNVANNTYIITPCNVDVEDAQIGNFPSDHDDATPSVTLTSDTLF